MQFFVNSVPVCGDTVPLGVQGENLATQITADVSGWLAQWPDGQVIVRLIDADNRSHLADTVVNDGTLVWIVTAADTAQGGYGVGVIELVQGDVVKKSEPFATRVITDPQASGQAPEPVPGWVEETIARMEELEAGAAQSAGAAQTSAGSAQASDQSAQAAAAQAAQSAEDAAAVLRQVETAGAAQVTAIQAAGQQQTQAVTAAGAQQVSAVQTEGADQRAAIEAAGAAQVTAIQAEGQTQQTAIQQKGADTLASIPADYTELSGDVADLKSQIDEISQKGIDASGATAGQVPVADGSGSWAWGNVSGDAMILGPEEIQKLVADGKAKSTFNIGDVIYIPWTDYTPSTPVVYQFPFVVVHIGDAYDQNDVLHHDALWLMAMYAEPEEIVFDAAEDTVVDLSTEPNALEGWYYWGLTGTNYTALNLSAGDAIPTTYDSVHKCAINNLGVLRYGYNRWRDSAYRQWLNSDAAKNANWWTSQHEGDVAPTSTYTNKPGWLYGFENRWLDVIKPVRVQTATNTVTDGGVTDVTYDRFFLPSLEQMYGNPQAAGVEGEYWEYWKEETGLDAPSNGSSGDPIEARKIPSVVNYPRGSAVYCRLRSAARGNGYSVWFVATGGYLNATSAYGAYRAIPACVIY